MKKRRQRPRLRGLPLAGRAEIKCTAASVCVSSRLGGPSHGHFPFLELAGHWDPLGWVLADEVPEFLRSLGHLSHQHWSAQQDLREPWPGPPQLPSWDSHLAHDAPSMSGHEAGSWGGGALSTLGLRPPLASRSPAHQLSLPTRPRGGIPSFSRHLLRPSLSTRCPLCTLSSRVL